MESFEKRQASEAAFEGRDRGVKNVDLEKIVGSVGRYHDFDSHFRLKPHLPAERFVRIKAAMAAGRPLAPVRLYRIKDRYYVLDGNHRVSAAKALGRKDIAAKIVELIPSENTLENIVYRERLEFEDATGLEEPVELTEMGQYDHLLKQIENHKCHLENQKNGSISFGQAARDWYDTIFKPMAGLIEGAGLAKSFPQRTVADLFAYISRHQWLLKRSRNYGGQMENLIQNDMEAFRTKMLDKKFEKYPEMQRCVTAFVLMKVQGKRELKIVEKLFSLPEVLEIHTVHGEFDIIAKIVLSRDLLSSDAEVISDFVHANIRMLNGVNTTQTLIPGMSKSKKDRDQSQVNL